jgi:toxin ParE1/3/4
LAELPESGRLIPEFKETFFRELIVDPCRIFYYFEEDVVYITRIIRSERMIRKYMLENVIHEDDANYILNKL